MVSKVHFFYYQRNMDAKFKLTLHYVNSLMLLKVLVLELCAFILKYLNLLNETKFNNSKKSMNKSKKIFKNYWLTLKAKFKKGTFREE